ncbi:hypothetical protein B795N_20730 [Marinilactibacillus psychrotolerans]|uniref:MazG-like family protein n=1 Tax=Marinilactibacillus psychrotolerans TaxID=191770 RepID=UPI001C7D319D|nr:MazG-like family protein [Marinilactibacillus psychrotolerans]GEQ34191.1 hypothetical protein B795N_20730 [Marinilactibacillus psychrotolerans]
MDKTIQQFLRTAKNESKSTEILLIKLTEEVGEVAEAYLSDNHSSLNENKNLTLQDYQEELVDTLMVAATLLVKTGINEKDCINLFNKKIKKWQSKQ